MWNKFWNTIKPTKTPMLKVVEDELYEVERYKLNAYVRLEHAQAEVQMLTARTNRLKTLVNTLKGNENATH